VKERANTHALAAAQAAWQAGSKGCSRFLFFVAGSRNNTLLFSSFFFFFYLETRT
jgi:hypothetical protein